MRYGFLAPLMLAAAAAPASPALDPAALEALRGIDLRLATIAHRLVTANAPLCDRQAPATGAVVHAVTQYDAATVANAKAVFGFATPIAIEAVVPGSAAARAGFRQDDGVAAVGDVILSANATPPSSTDRDAALGVLERQTSPVRFAIVREGMRRNVAVTAPLGCRARFEVLLGPKMTAQSDGTTVQIGVRFFERYRDEETAVIVAHELAHIVLHHRARLEAAGVKGGLLGEIGRNARIGQRAETEADTLGVALLYNAGYDPASAARFWRTHGSDIDGGIFRSRTHPATKARIAAIEATAQAIGNAPRPYRPPILATRDAPLN